MDFDHSPKVQALQKKVAAFMERHVYPSEKRYREELDAGGRWQPPPVIDELKKKARTEELWNLFLPESKRGAGLTNLEYAPLCEIMGRVAWAPEVFNCSAPDTGNMETIERYGTEAQKKEWLEPLLEGKIRSCFAMTEPRVASSDATNIESRIERRGDSYIINGRKWWSSGAPDPRCKLFIFMGKTDPANPNRHQQQSMILVPRDAKGVKIIRSLPVFGFDDAPHGHAEVEFENVEVPVTNMLLGEGRGFEIAQGRLGPGRIHHTMRAIGQAEVALEKMCRRVKSRVAFGKPIAEQTVTLERIAESRILIDQARLLVLKAADKMDKAGNKVAAAEIAMIKVAAPNMLCQVHRLGDPGAWRRRRDGGLRACRDVRPRPLHAHLRRPRRGASQPDRPPGTAQARLNEATAMEAQAPPEGFAPHFKKSAVTDPWEPLFSRRSGKEFQLGLWLREATLQLARLPAWGRHCRAGGQRHGDRLRCQPAGGPQRTDRKLERGLRGERQGRPVAADRSARREDRQYAGLCRCVGHRRRGDRRPRLGNLSHAELSAAELRRYRWLPAWRTAHCKLLRNKHETAAIGCECRCQR